MDEQESCKHARDPSSIFVAFMKIVDYYVHCCTLLKLSADCNTQSMERGLRDVILHPWSGMLTKD